MCGCAGVYPSMADSTVRAGCGGSQQQNPHPAPRKASPTDTDVGTPGLRRLAHLLVKLEVRTSALESALAMAEAVERRLDAELVVARRLAEEAGFSLRSDRGRPDRAGPRPVAVDLSVGDAAVYLGRSPDALRKFLSRNERRGRCEVGPGVTAYRKGRRWFVRMPTSTN